MTPLLRQILEKNLAAYKKERDELMGISKQPLLSEAGAPTQHSQHIWKLIAYVDAYTELLNLVNHVPKETNEAMSDSELRLHMINTFLEEVPVNWNPSPPNLASPEESRAVLNKAGEAISGMPFGPETFPALLWFWYMAKYHPATPKFDPPVEPPPEVA